MPRITERLVQTAKARKRTYEMTCSVFTGFILRVLPSGKKVYYVRVRRGGRYSRIRVGAAEQLSLAQAQERARYILGAVRQGGFPSTSAEAPTGAVTRGAPPRLRDFAERYLADHVDRRLKPSTRAKYRDHIRHLVRVFGSDRLDRLAREAIERWHGSRSRTPSAANSALRVLGHMFTKAVDWGLLDPHHPNPARGVRMHRERRRERFLTANERRRLEQTLRRHEATACGRAGSISWATAGAIRLLAFTGMRRSEVLGLQWSMVDDQHRCLRLPDSKTGPKIVPLGSPALELLRALARHRSTTSPYVLRSKGGQPLNPQALGRSWRRLRKRAGIPDVRLHDLRHSAASDALMAGVPLAVVGKILGHRQPNTTARYAHISDAVLTEAVETMARAIAERSEYGRNSRGEES